jgi:glycosyltransferase involved in cell wall biosynthesis
LHLRIIVLNDHGSVTGGAAQVAIAGVKALADAGHDVTFVSSVGPVDTNIDRNCVRTHCFGFHDLLGNPSRLTSAMHGLWDPRCAGLFGNILQEYDPLDTIIHLHTWVKSLSSSIVREAVKRKFRIVCTLHDYFTVCPNGGFYNYQTLKQCDLAPMSFACISTHCDMRSYSQKLWRVSRQAVQRKIGYMPDGVSNFITVSDYSESILRRWLPMSAKFYRVHNPIDIEKSPPADHSINDAFTFVGRLSPEKGATLFAAAALKAKVKAIFVGSGAEGGAIKEINPHAELLGWQDRNGVIQAIRSSRAVVFPSLLHETQGLVVTEAAALGIPAIVSDACAARDNIINGKTGLLFRSGNVDDLASKLQLLRSDNQLVNDLGSTAYNRYWSAPCTRELHAAELISCYENILASNGRALR